MGYRLTCIFWIIVSIWGLHGQSLKFEHYNDASGLSHNSVRHIVQDNNGFLWFGTFSGLNRFDGYEFKSYTSASPSENTIPNDDITALEFNQEANQLWIGTRNGLARFDLNTYRFKVFLPDPANVGSLQDKEIRSVHIDSFKRVWVGTKDQGLFLYDSHNESFSKVPLEGFTYIKEIFEDSKGHIWVGSYGAVGIARISLDNLGSIVQVKQYSLLPENLKESNPYINFIYEDHKADLFVGSRNGLFKLNASEDRFEDLPIEDMGVRDKLGPYFISIAKAPNGKYWLGTLGGIVQVDELEDLRKQKYQWYFSELSDDDSLVDNLVSALYFDASGVLWVGTEEGLDKYDPYENQFTYNTSISRYIDNQVPRIRDFSKTFDGKIIVATRHNGLFVSEDNRYIPLYQTAKDIASMFSIDGKVFYCGLWDGKILIYDYVRKTNKVIDVGIDKAPILAFAPLGNRHMVIGSHGEGAVVLDVKTKQVDTSFGNLLPGLDINAIKESDEKIWFATQMGAYCYDKSSMKVKVFEARSEDHIGVPHNNVSDIAIDVSGKVWAATRKGLCYYDVSLDDFVPITDIDGLKDRWVTNFVAQKDGFLWLNMNNNNLGKLDIASKELKLYHTESGNRLDIFSTRGFYYADETHMYLGGKDGVITFSPKGLSVNEYAPKPIISSIRVQNKAVEIGSVVNGQEILKSDINLGRKLVLENSNKNFSLTFSSPSYVNGRQNRYSYILEGFDENWNTVDVRQRTVQYTNLFSGDYVFKLRAMNSHGVWSDVSSYQIEILPPFWFTYKAFFLMLLVLALAFYLIRKQIRARIVLKQQWLMEKVKRERDEKLNNEKLRFFTNISHELRTPLTLILGPAKQLIEDGKDSGNYFQQSRYNLIHQNANRLLNLVNQVLDFRRAQSGELRLKVTKTDILLYTKNTFRSFEELADDKKINFNLICEHQNIEGYIDRDKFDKMLYNLLSNALKFTQGYGHVDLFIEVKEEKGGAHLLVEVSDDGIGIPKESQEKVFSRFYQAPNSTSLNTGSGIGLSLVKALVELHKGKITIESELNKGSVFTLKLPIDRKAYDDDEVFDYEKSQVVEESPQLITAKKIIQSTHLKERILIIEDNAELRSYLVDYLSDYYKVFEAENGKKGLEVCLKVKPAICIADIMMPVKNGLEFCKALKNDADISHIPVILLTALSDNDDKIKGYSSGADGYLVKPFDPSLLKTRIENIINSRKELKNRFSEEIESQVNTLTHSPIDQSFMEKLTELIHENMGNSDLNTSLLCQALGMSSSKLYRKIKELTDLAPNEFIRTIRLKKSAQLLRTKKYNVSEVTSLIGFSDPLYFSRCFKKQFGYPPSQLIK
ncbi:hybrid sensor histidine kinase/response regulator transcription factor [Zobellia galactanivorans]|uniref:hybrid sensor histidine kinase/response regulator transcription factor n=1 Tax=Zobellia galactanivorans (strain DSM 12802 / CCUG 47099 / CIP 106680 / NCIMB 13871 / Dsij) TaxID=63186 RepID=UPI001C069CBB|nr:hybrid sensor histidine kinase/response regulator transcription factor [Zobellia galactanivorans]MBU3025693.1 response regulator [Zobellia galactanivorans]